MTDKSANRIKTVSRSRTIRFRSKSLPYGTKLSVSSETWSRTQAFDDLPGKEICTGKTDYPVAGNAIAFQTGLLMVTGCARTPFGHASLSFP